MSGFIMKPDHASALVAHYRSLPVITGHVTSNHIAMEIPRIVPDENGNFPTWLVVIKSGGPGAIDDSPYSDRRVDIHCYASTGYKAMQAALAVDSVMVPVDRKSTRIHSQGVVISKVTQELSEFGRETPEGWPFVLLVYMLRVYEVPVPMGAA